MQKERNDGDFPFWRIWMAAQWILLAILLLLIVDAASGQPVRPSDGLSLREAVDRALAPGGNARVAIAQAIAEQARARDRAVRADLLPNLDGAISQSSQTRNLQALGIQIALPVPGFEQPRFVGPFNVFDARITATQTLFSISAIRRYQAAKEGRSAAAAEQEHVRQTVIALVAKSYFAVQRAEAQMAAADATLGLARDLESLANQQRVAGTGIALEVTSATVQTSQAEQARLARELELDAAKLQLLRVIGDSMEGPVQLRDALQPPIDDLPDLHASLLIARGERADIKGQYARATGARHLHGSAKWDRLPTVVAFGDYGASGNTPNSSLPTRVVGVSARVPIFDGGRRDALRAEADAKAREEELRTRDL